MAPTQRTNAPPVLSSKFSRQTGRPPTTTVKPPQPATEASPDLLDIMFVAEPPAKKRRPEPHDPVDDWYESHVDDTGVDNSGTSSTCKEPCTGQVSNSAIFCLHTAHSVQKVSLLSDFMSNHLETFQDILIKRHAGPVVTDHCECGSGTSPTTHCVDCVQYPPACNGCFIAHHKHNPTHWAEVWDNQEGFYRHHDISCLQLNPPPPLSTVTMQMKTYSPDDESSKLSPSLSHTSSSPESASYFIPLGHFSEQCPNARANPVFDIILVDMNGIHGTKVQYCACHGQHLWRDEKAEQLLVSGFVPATWKDPRTAFAVRVLKHFHNHQHILSEFTDGL
jgi:hypothetical protein